MIFPVEQILKGALGQKFSSRVVGVCIAAKGGGYEGRAKPPLERDVCLTTPIICVNIMGNEASFQMSCITERSGITGYIQILR
jgi:hypothetical protein